MKRASSPRRASEAPRCCLRTEIRETGGEPRRYAVRLVDLRTGLPATPARVCDTLAEARQQAAVLIAPIARL